MSERSQPKLIVEGSAALRSLEEQHRLMDEYDTAAYESGIDEDAFQAAMAAREHEKNVEIEGRIMQEAQTRRMYMMAQNIAELRASGADENTVSDKEDKLQELMLEFSENAHSMRDDENRTAEQERATPKGDAIRLDKQIAAEEAHAERMEELDFIIKATEASNTDTAGTEQGQTNETDTPKEASLLPEYTVDQIDSRLKGLEDAKTRITAEHDGSESDDAASTESEPAYDSEAQQQRRHERLDGEPLVADGLDDMVVEAEPLTADGLEPLVVPVQDGESLEDYEQRTGATAEQADEAAGLDDDVEGEEPEVRQSRRLRDRMNPTAWYHRIKAGNFQRRERNAANETDDDSKEKSRTRLAAGLGILAVAAVGVGVILANKYGVDYQPGSGGAGKGKTGGGEGIGAKMNELFGNGSMDVRSGDGHTQVLDRVLDSHNVHLKPQELLELHQHLEHVQGGNYIDLTGANDVYTMADGSNGLSRPDSGAHITDKAQREAVRWLQRQGKL